MPRITLIKTSCKGPDALDTLIQELEDTDLDCVVDALECPDSEMALVHLDAGYDAVELWTMIFGRKDLTLAQ